MMLSIPGRSTAMMPLRLSSVLFTFSMLAFACPLLAAQLTPGLSAEQGRAGCVRASGTVRRRRSIRQR